MDNNCDGIDGVDGDGDSQASVASGGTDCDDSNPNVFAGQIDTVGNGLDDNCDGIDGVDNDGDEYASLASGGDDCDDQDLTKNPGMVDTVGNGIDNNCDGIDGVDNDGDEQASVSSGGTDCNDGNPNVFTGQDDTVGNDIDDNCDGIDGVDGDGDGHASVASGGDDCEDQNPFVYDLACSDGNPCTVDACIAYSGCQHTDVADGEPCEDGNECTANDICLAGVCNAGPFTCVEDCDNELDDDQDDLVDCNDGDCALDMACQLGGDHCGEAFDLTLGVPLTTADPGAFIQFFGTTVGKTDVFTASCDADTSSSPDTVHKVELGEPMGLAISGDFNAGAWATLSILNSTCTADIACETKDTSAPTELTVMLPAGTYFIVMDGAYPGDLATYTLEVEVFLPSVTEDVCDDGIDNDADGLTDCDDDECSDTEICNILTGETCEDALLLSEEPLTAAAAGTEIIVTGSTAGQLDHARDGGRVWAHEHRVIRRKRGYRS